MARQAMLIFHPSGEQGCKITKLSKTAPDRNESLANSVEDTAEEITEAEREFKAMIDKAGNNQ
ncbi:MAG: hypothetical protein K2O20_09170 [Duncaniella sp.]|nr:hypothetical protein [Duncaniella sp.]